MKRTLILTTVSLLLSATASAFQGGGGESTKAENRPKKSGQPKPTLSSKPTPKPPRGNVSGTLVIQVNEPESEVFLSGKNGSVLGKIDSVITAADGSPLQLKEVRVGTYTLRVKKLGFYDVSRKVDVRGRSQTINVQLLAAVAYLTITCSAVPDAIIDVEGVGRFVGNTSRLAVKPGKYHINITRKGYQPRTDIVEVAVPGEESYQIIKLDRIPTSQILQSAQSAFEKGEFDKAASLSREILEFEPENARGNLFVGRALFEKGDPGAVDYLFKALRQRETVSVDVHAYREDAGKQILPARLVIDRESLRLDIPTAPDKSFWIFKSDLKTVQQKVDKYNLRFVMYLGKGDAGNGRKIDREITIYSRWVFFRSGSDRETFCQQDGSSPLRCDNEAAILYELISKWQIQLK